MPLVDTIYNLVGNNNDKEDHITVDQQDTKTAMKNASLTTTISIVTITNGTKESNHVSNTKTYSSNTVSKMPIALLIFKVLQSNMTI